MVKIDLLLMVTPLIIACCTVILVGFFFIPFLKKLNFRQNIRSQGPKGHIKKVGTPTMGGVIFLFAIFCTALPFGSFTLLNQKAKFINSDLFLLLFSVLSYGLLGFLDDYIKVTKGRNLGLTVNQKWLGQLLIGLVFFWVLLTVRVFESDKYIFQVMIPGLNYKLQLNWLYLPLLLFIMVGTSNAVNLTDGLDGLVSGVAIFSYGAYALIGFLQGNVTVFIFATCVIGSLLGFLVFNFHPAKVFMGDTGSLALGGGLAALAVITKTELLLPIIGGVFVIETLSVIIQVISFKLRKKRIFRMSPLHHHFELLGYSELQVVLGFWLVSFFFSLAGIFLWSF